MNRPKRGLGPRVLSGISSSQPSRYTTAPFSFMPQLESILTPLNLSGEDYRDLLIAFFLSEQLFSLYKRMLNDFHLVRNKLGQFTN